MPERPGIMFYFDLRPALSMLSDEEAGKLFKAAMEYGEFGVVPEFDGMAAMAWTFIQPKIDRDRDSYDLKRRKSEYAAFCSHLSEGARKPSFDEWEQRVQADAGECKRTLPTTTTTTTTTQATTTAETPIASSTSSSAGAGAGKGRAAGVRGRGEGETDVNDINSLRNAALDMLDQYMKRS